MIGIAGGDIKSRVPSSWSQAAISTEVNIIQHYKFSKKKPEHLLITNPATSGNAKKVILLDGAWLCTKKEVFERFQFDEITFTGFHGYDIDYSLQVSGAYNLYVIFDILIHHYSEGNPDRNWVKSALLVNKKWKERLPVSVYSLSEERYNLHYWHSLRIFLQQLFRLKYSFHRIIGYYLIYSFSPYFSVRRFISLGKFLLLQMISRRPSA